MLRTNIDSERGETCLGGRGVSFFDDFGDYPDFIVWLKDDVRQHVLLLTGPRQQFPLTGIS